MKSKRIICLLLVFAMFAVHGINGNAVSIDESKDELRKQFMFGEGPKVGLYDIDYRYYSPVKENDEKKYPLVIWLHGHSHGEHEGYQIESNDIVNWSSDEYQSRFGNGAYIFAARAPEDLGVSWGSELVPSLKAAIDDFVLKNYENIDTNRIYIGGFSLGGMMTFKMAIEYPDMFAAIFPICPFTTVSNSDAKRISDIPVWLVSGKRDMIVNYEFMTKANWNAVVNTNSRLESCRFTTLEKTCKPDGSSAPNGHYAWIAVTYDMFSSVNGEYPYMNTVNGNGESVSLEFPNGMISWLSEFSSEYEVNSNVSNTDYEISLNLFSIIFAPIMRVYFLVRNLIRPLFG